MKDLGQYIRQMREDKNMTIEELSKKTLISPGVLKDIEAGKFDKYQSDEAYVKMYLKKISNVLSLNTEEVTQEYISLTKEIHLAELRQKELETSKKEDIVKKGQDFKFTKPQLARKPSVYEDKSHITIIRGVIVLLILCSIVAVVWYGISSTKSQTDNPSVPDNPMTTEGEVNTSDDPTNDPNTNTDPNPSTTEPQNAGIQFTRIENAGTNVLGFEMTLPEDAEEFTLKIEFVNRVWVKMDVNGKNYRDFPSGTYHDNDNADEPETVELTFKVSEFKDLSLRTGNNMGHRYYVNNQEVPLEDEDYSTSPGYFQLKLKK